MIDHAHDFVRNKSEIRGNMVTNLKHNHIFMIEYLIIAVHIMCNIC